MSYRRSLKTAVWVLLAVAITTSTPVTADAVADAVRAYDSGNYDAACRDLRAAPIETLSGPVLYRLFFCQSRAGEAAAARQTLGRSVTALERAMTKPEGLDVPFYLVNAYQELNRREDAVRTAAKGTALVEFGDLPEPKDPIDLFRLGKLYADQQRPEDAKEWYGKLLAGDPEGVPTPYLQRARAYVARQDAVADGTAPPRPPAPTAPSGAGPAQTELERVAVEHARNGRFGDSANAWKEAQLLNPGGAERAKYCQHLTRMAERLGELPATTSSGRNWSSLSKEELADEMKAQAEALKLLVEESKTFFEERKPYVGADRQALSLELRGETVPRELKKKRKKLAELDERGIELRASLESRVREAQGQFVAAALEFAFARYGIREQAFFGGFAPLIFRHREWDVTRGLPKAKGNRSPS